MSAIDSRPRIVITYCTQCRWLLRATWLAQELLTTFTTEVGELALQPGTGGVFRVAVDDEVLWDRKVEGGFPDLGPLIRGWWPLLLIVAGVLILVRRRR